MGILHQPAPENKIDEGCQSHLLNISYKGYSIVMRIGVYGLGRFGGFWALALAKSGAEVIAYSRSSHEVPDNVRLASEDEVLNAPYLFFCVTISAFESVLKRVGSRIGKDTVVMDTCSVKTYPAKWMKENIPSDVYKIATHPMFGPDSGSKGLAGLPVVICPISPVDYRYEEVKNLFLSMGLKVLEMSEREHDEEAAYSQGVTHFVGRVLDQMGLKPTEIATQGYKSLMTIAEQTCNDPIQLFYDLQRYNPYAKEMRLSLQVAVEKVLNRLAKEEDKI